MSVGSVSGVVASASTDSEATVLVARKALDVQKQQGEDLMRLMASADVEGHKGNNVDVVV